MSHQVITFIVGLPTVAGLQQSIQPQSSPGREHYYKGDSPTIFPTITRLKENDVGSDSILVIDIARWLIQAHPIHYAIATNTNTSRSAVFMRAYRSPFCFAVDASYATGHIVHIVKCMTTNAPFLVEGTED